MNAFLDAILQLAATGVLALGGYAITRLGAWLRLREDSEVRGYLNQALERGVDLALAEARGRMPTYAKLALPEVDGVVERVAEYARATVPGALAHFGIDSQGLRERASARIAARNPVGPGAAVHAAG